MRFLQYLEIGHILPAYGLTKETDMKNTTKTTKAFYEIAFTRLSEHGSEVEGNVFLKEFPDVQAFNQYLECEVPEMANKVVRARYRYFGTDFGTVAWGYKFYY